jgi:hypothetical protein
MAVASAQSQDLSSHGCRTRVVTCVKDGESNSSFQVWDAARPDDRAAWLAQWQVWPGREVFAHPGYLELFKTRSDRVQCACFTSPAGTALYPFILHDLTNELYWRSTDGPATDIAVPFSYGGPVACSVHNRQTLAEGFWLAFDRWAATVGAVSEFVRLTLFQELLIDDLAHRELRQQNVVRSLESSESEIWMEFRHKVRKNVNRAGQSGVRVEFDPDGQRLDEFLGIYSGTMARRQAGTEFYFDRQFFQRLHQNLVGQFAYFHAIHRNRIISTELVLVSAENVYSSLGGTEQDSFSLRPNDLLKWEIIRWARSAGKQCFVLGGGAVPNDGIFRYKLAFAPSGAVDFFLRKRILRSDRYHLFCDRGAALRLAANRPAAGDFFPAYRA